MPDYTSTPFYPGAAPAIPTGDASLPVKQSTWERASNEINNIGSDLVNARLDVTTYTHPADTTLTTSFTNLELFLNAVKNVILDLSTRVAGSPRWFHDSVDSTLLRNQIGLRIPVRNATGATITVGSLVYISGRDASNRLLITKAIASAETTLAAFIVVDNDILTATDGYVSNQSTVTTINTTGQVVGDAVYLSGATAGLTTFTAPSTAQTIGRVVTVANPGIILFDINPRKDGGSASGDPTFNTIKVYPSTDTDAGIFKAAAATLTTLEGFSQATNRLTQWQNSTPTTLLRTHIYSRSIGGSARDLIDFELRPVIAASSSYPTIPSTYLRLVASLYTTADGERKRHVFLRAFGSPALTDPAGQDYYGLSIRGHDERPRFVFNMSDDGLGSDEAFDIRASLSSSHVRFVTFTDLAQGTVRNDRVFDFTRRYTEADELWIRLINAAGVEQSVALKFTNDGNVKFPNVATGSGSAALSTNCPAVTVSAPYTWIKIQTSDGSVAYIPAWK